MAVIAPVQTTFGGVFIDTAEVWPYLGMDAAPAGVALTRLQRLIDSACATAQTAVNRPIAPTRIQERHDGWSGDTIVLRYSPFLQLVSCVENMSTGGPITLPESTPGANGFDGVAIDYATSIITRTFAGGWPRPFFPGLRNIEVTYVAGFNPVPADLWEATVDLAAYKWRMSQEQPRWFQSAGDEYGGAQSSLLYPGIPNRIAETFASYRLPGV